MRSIAAIRSQIFGATVLLALGCMSTGEATAQVAANNAAQTTNLTNSRPYQKPMYVQGAVVLALVGGAVFAVCRSSRRV